MDLTSAITLLGIALANIGTTIGLFLWSTGNANEFRKEAKTTAEENRKEALEFHRQVTGILQAIQDEMRDFHGRMCAIEERSRNR